MTLLRLAERGLYCEAGDFYIDPWQGVTRAVIGEGVLRTRLGPSATIRAVDWGESIDVDGVSVSLHPAGHILGSAQVRVEHRGEVWVASGDYKTDPDPTCTPFELLRCHTFITESTFGLPIYRWTPDAEVFDAIRAWWR
ncbi:MAG: Exonuclease of the beta-lactamase fold involved in processing-like protein, partial [Geminicoccaceae bacterium]|nr:Exonuclease of the beta-lactamase fold involved in processing-like protein [Geminicoccaceae bacterium]